MLSKGFRCCIAHPRSPKFHIKVARLNGRCETAKQTHGPWGVWWQGPRGVRKRNVQKLYFGPWKVQKLLLPIATCCYLLQCSWVSFHDFVAALQRSRLGQNAYDIRRWADSGAWSGAFWICHTTKVDVIVWYQVASHVIDTFDVAILEYLVKKVIPNLFAT